MIDNNTYVIVTCTREGEGILGHPELSKAFRASISNTLATTVIVRESLFN